MTDIAVTISQAAIAVTMTGGASNNFVESGTKFSFNGSGGNSYLIFNSTTGKIELFVGGTKKAAWG